MTAGKDLSGVDVRFGSLADKPSHAKIQVCPLLSESGQMGGLRTPEELYKREGA